MKLLFKQRLFSWFDSYDIYDEAGNTVYIVKGQLSWGHKLVIYDAYGNEVGTRHTHRTCRKRHGFRHQRRTKRRNQRQEIGRAHV